MRRGQRMIVAIGLVLVLAGILVAFWPLHSHGLSGSAAYPHHASGPAGHGSLAYLSVRPGAIAAPDVVGHRRALALGLGALGLLVLVTVSVVARARRPSGRR